MESFNPFLRESQPGQSFTTNFFELFPELEFGINSVDMFVEQTRAPKNACQLGSLFRIMNGKSKGLYSSTIYFQCTIPNCSAQFKLQRNKQKLYFIAGSQLFHNHAQLDEQAIIERRKRFNNKSEKSNMLLIMFIYRGSREAGAGRSKDLEIRS